MSKIKTAPTAARKKPRVAHMPALPHLQPDIRIWGEIESETADQFLEQLDKYRRKKGPVVLELGTVGGEADAARRIAHEIRIARDEQGIDIYFLGQTCVYSAGVVIMAAFKKERRFLTRETLIMVHERRMDKQVKFYGALSNCLQTARELISQFEIGQRIEQDDFRKLADGSNITPEEIMERARSNWYVTAEECLERGLIAGII